MKSGRRCSMAGDHTPHSEALERPDPSSGPYPMCRAIERWPNASCPDPWHHNHGRPFVRGERVLER